MNTHERQVAVDEFLEEHGGVVSVSELAEVTKVPESTVRRFARSAGVRRIGATFVFDAKRAGAFVRDLDRISERPKGSLQVERQLKKLQKLQKECEECARWVSEELDRVRSEKGPRDYYHNGYENALMETRARLPSSARKGASR